VDGCCVIFVAQSGHVRGGMSCVGASGIAARRQGLWPDAEWFSPGGRWCACRVGARCLGSGPCHEAATFTSLHFKQRTRKPPLMDTASVTMTTCSVAAAVLAARACTLANAYSLVPSLASKVLPGSQSNWQQPVMLW
jgi:hypothetical protein